jgi:hypothetical protein
MFERRAADKVLGLENVVYLAAGRDEADGIAKRIRTPIAVAPVRRIRGAGRPLAPRLLTVYANTQRVEVGFELTGRSGPAPAIDNGVFQL